MSSSLTRPRHVLQWQSNFTRSIVKSSLGGGVYALSAMVDHLLTARCAPLEVMDSEVAGLEDCESLFTELKTEKVVAEKYLARYFLSAQQASRQGELNSAHWLPGVEYPADGSAKVASTRILSYDYWNRGGSILVLRGPPREWPGGKATGVRYFVIRILARAPRSPASLYVCVLLFSGCCIQRGF